ncbi:MAG: hypothetical protein WD872_01015, partial [Pirellulaceae bacterium]
ENSALQRAAADLLAATRTRQWAERQLQTSVESLAGTISIPWSVEPARVVVRVGGTPRALTLVGGGLIALLAGGLMFACSVALVPRLRIQNTDELTAALPLPLVAHTPIESGRRAARRTWRISPWAVKGMLKLAELTLAAFMLALVFSMLADRAVAAQVLADPFGVQSEVVGRLFGA